MNIIDLQKWKRKSYFEFFGAFDEPFFSITSNVNTSKVLMQCQKDGHSFFAAYLFCALAAANTIPEFRTRLLDATIVEYEVVHASPTLGREDGSFGFSFLQHTPDFIMFSNAIKSETARILTFEGLGLSQTVERLDVIHFSSLPWLHFTGVSHARHQAKKDSIPKITFGKMSDDGLMPISVCLHHGFADGIHAAKFLEKFQNNLDTFEEELRMKI